MAYNNILKTDFFETGAQRSWHWHRFFDLRPTRMPDRARV